jgi:general secretion pathway protein F
MPTYSYRALTQVGEVVSGSLSAPNAAEVGRRIEYLGLVPIESIAEQSEARIKRGNQISVFSRPRAEDVTIFTGDLALLLRTGTRINDALELLGSDRDLGRMRPTTSALAAAIMSGESFADAISSHPQVFPQFANVFRDFNAKLDPILVAFLALSDFLRGNLQALGAGLACFVLSALLLSRRPAVRGAAMGVVARLPLVRGVMSYHRTTLFCRNLGLLLSSGVTFTASLRILAEMMSSDGNSTAWTAIVDRVRHGGKLSDSLAATGALPPMAIRTLRLGEQSGQLPTLAGRIAEFYEAKLQRSLDRMIGMVGPVAIIVISLIVGGLIVSVMTALLSVNQVVE